MKCLKCNFQLSDKANFCEGCGEKVIRHETIVSKNTSTKDLYTEKERNMAKPLGFNPKVKNLIEDKDITVMGLFFAGWWRFCLLLLGIYVVIFFVLAIFNDWIS